MPNEMNPLRALIRAAEAYGETRVESDLLVGDLTPVQITRIMKMHTLKLGQRYYGTLNSVRNPITLDFTCGYCSTSGSALLSLPGNLPSICKKCSGVFYYHGYIVANPQQNSTEALALFRAPTTVDANIIPGNSVVIMGVQDKAKPLSTYDRIKQRLLGRGDAPEWGPSPAEALDALNAASDAVVYEGNAAPPAGMSFTTNVTGPSKTTIDMASYAEQQIRDAMAQAVRAGAPPPGGAMSYMDAMKKMYAEQIEAMIGSKPPLIEKFTDEEYRSGLAALERQVEERNQQLREQAALTRKEFEDLQTGLKANPLDESIRQKMLDDLAAVRARAEEEAAEYRKAQVEQQQRRKRIDDLYNAYRVDAEGIRLRPPGNKRLPTPPWSSPPSPQFDYDPRPRSAGVQPKTEPDLTAPARRRIRTDDI